MSNDVNNVSSAYLQDVPVVKPSQLQKLLAMLYVEGGGAVARPLLVLGPPGVGKTEIIKTAEVFSGRPFRTFYAGYADRTDIAGYPVPCPDEGLVRVMPTDAVLGFMAQGEQELPPVLFLDEVTNAPRDVQSVLLELLRRGTVNDRRLPEGAAVVLAGNLHTHAAGSHKLITSLDDRVVKVQLAPDVDDWCNHMLQRVSQSSFCLDMVAMVRMDPRLLHDWSPTAETVTTPRALTDCVRALDGAMQQLGHDPMDPEAQVSDEERVMLLTVAAGHIGMGRAMTLFGMRDLRSKLPPVNEIVTDPDGVPMVPEDEPQLIAACVTMVVGRLHRTRSAEEFCAGLRYINRHSVMHAAMYVVMAKHVVGSEVLEGEYFGEWVTQHADLLF